MMMIQFSWLLFPKCLFQRYGRYFRTMIHILCLWVWMKLIWTSLSIWSGGSTGLSPCEHITCVMPRKVRYWVVVAFGTNGHSCAWVFVYVLIIKVCFYINLIHVFCLHKKRIIQTYLRFSQRKMDCPLCCLRTVQAPPLLCQGLTGKRWSLERVQKKPWGKCAFALSRKHL